MILNQFYLNCLAHASYLVGDEATGTAAVVDPRCDIDQYLAFADEHRLRIAHVILTHLHADFRRAVVSAPPQLVDVRAHHDRLGREVAIKVL